MIRRILNRSFLPVLGLALLGAVALILSSGRLRAGQDSQQQSPQSQSGQKQGQSQDKSKKKGGFFNTLKAATGSSSQQTSATASAGTKGVGDEDGQKIANTTPTAADQQAVTAMEKYSLPQGALPKFIEDGNLKPKQ